METWRVSDFFLALFSEQEKKKKKRRKPLSFSLKKRRKPLSFSLTGEDQPVDGVEQPPELPVRDVEANWHRPASRRLDPLDVGRGDVGAFFFFFLK